GIRWVQGNGQGANAVCYGNGIFVNAKTWGHPNISTNGTDWSGASSPFLTLHGVACGNGIFVAVGRNQILTSKDGKVWTDLRPPPSRLLFGKPYDNGQNFMPVP